MNRDQGATVSDDARAMMMFQANQKSMLVSYLLWFFLGALGAHRFYNGRVGSGLAQLALTIGTPVLLSLGGFTAIARGDWVTGSVGIIAGVAIGIWWLVDAFLIPGWIKRHNNRLATHLSGR